MPGASSRPASPPGARARPPGPAPHLASRADDPERRAPRPRLLRAESQATARQRAAEPHERLLPGERDVGGAWTRRVGPPGAMPPISFYLCIVSGRQGSTRSPLWALRARGAARLGLAGLDAVFSAPTRLRAPSPRPPFSWAFSRPAAPDTLRSPFPGWRARRGTRGTRHTLADPALREAGSAWPRLGTCSRIALSANRGAAPPAARGSLGAPAPRCASSTPSRTLPRPPPTSTRSSGRRIPR